MVDHFVGAEGIGDRHAGPHWDRLPRRSKGQPAAKQSSGATPEEDQPQSEEIGEVSRDGVRTGLGLNVNRKV